MATLACALLLVACGGPPPPTRFSRVTSYIPAEAPYVLVTSTLRESQSSFRASYGESLVGLEDNFFIGSYREALRDALGVDILDAESLESIGLDLRGDVAIFGLGLSPAALVRLDDRERFREFIESVRQESEGMLQTLEVIDGERIETLHLDAARLTYTEVGGYLLVVLHRGHRSLEDLLGPLLYGQRPRPSLSESDVFRAAQGELGPSYGSVVMINFERLDAVLLDRARPELDPRLAFVEGARQEAFLLEERARMERCREAGRALVTSTPWAALGLRQPAPRRYEQRLLAPLAPDTAADAARVLAPLELAVGTLFPDAGLSFGASVDLAALVALDAPPSELVFCPNLAALSGAVGLLSRRLGQTDAAQVLGRGLYLSVEDFDLLLGAFSNRSARIILETLDMEQALRGWELYFEGLDMPVELDDEAGLRYVDAGPLTMHLAPLGERLVLGAGYWDPDALTERLEASAGVQDHFAVLHLEGPKMAAMMRTLIAALNVFGSLDTQPLTDLATLVERVESIHVEARIRAGFFEVESVVETRDEAKDEAE